MLAFPAGAPMDDTLNQVWTILVEIVTNLLNPDAWRRVLEKPEVFWAAFIAVTLIVFTETGLLVGFFLPGDSLLVTVGIVGTSVGWPVQYLIPALWAAAILGDSSGYLIGRTFGPAAVHEGEVVLLPQGLPADGPGVLRAARRQDDHPGQVRARSSGRSPRWSPGPARMPYRRFVAFSVVGVLGWITSMILLGYTLTPVARPAAEADLRPQSSRSRETIDKVIVVVLLASVAADRRPRAFMKYLARREGDRQGAGQPPVPMA